jgi:hypothetical protein
MMATWFQGTVDEFIAVSKAGFEKGVRILHFPGGTSIRIALSPETRKDERDAWKAFELTAELSNNNDRPLCEPRNVLNLARHVQDGAVLLGRAADRRQCHRSADLHLDVRLDPGCALTE